MQMNWATGKFEGTQARPLPGDNPLIPAGLDPTLHDLLGAVDGQTLASFNHPEAVAMRKADNPWLPPAADDTDTDAAEGRAFAKRFGSKSGNALRNRLMAKLAGGSKLVKQVGDWLIERDEAGEILAAVSIAD